VQPVRYRALLAYDGSRYLGSQRLPTGSIQGEVESALATICGQSVNIMIAGRTDTGVHATGQVIAFDIDWRHQAIDLLRAINALLPTDIAVQRIERAEPDFHPRFQATSRAYRYLVYESEVRHPALVKTAWWVRSPLEAVAMNEAAALLIGPHDFASFGTPPETGSRSTRREVFRSAWGDVKPLYEGRLLAFEIEANAFLYHMVRAIVGTLVEIGSGRMTVSNFLKAFQAKERAKIRHLAPAHGLTLVEVNYNEAGRRSAGDNQDEIQDLHTH
jgi:tRNA pseudouridine38-40 synthase